MQKRGVWSDGWGELHGTIAIAIAPNLNPTSKLIAKTSVIALEEELGAWSDSLDPRFNTFFLSIITYNYNTSFLTCHWPTTASMNILFRVCLDRTYFAKIENWKHCSKIIFKCVNSIVRLIFNEKVTEKWCLWVREQCTNALFTIEKSTKLALERKKKKKKKTENANVKRKSWIQTKP